VKNEDRSKQFEELKRLFEQEKPKQEKGISGGGFEAYRATPHGSCPTCGRCRCCDGWDPWRTKPWRPEPYWGTADRNTLISKF
jgi:hypothetical protein